MECSRLTFPPESILSRLLLPKLLYCQPDCVQYSSQVYIEHAQIGLLKTRGSRIIGDPSTFPYPGDRIDIVDATEVCNSLTECLCLRIPVCGIKVNTPCYLGIFVEFRNYLFSPSEVSVGNEYFYA